MINTKNKIYFFVLAVLSNWYQKYFFLSRLVKMTLKTVRHSYPDWRGWPKKLKAEAQVRQPKNWKPWGALYGYVAMTKKFWAKPHSYPFVQAALSFVFGMRSSEFVTVATVS
jgi:hypothetical protein